MKRLPQVALGAVVMMGMMGVGAQAMAADSAPLRIASDVPYHPYEWQTPDGTYTGFEVDLVNAVCEKMQRKCEWQTQKFDGIIPGLMARKYDMIASAMIESAARDRVVAFSTPYFNTPSVWIARVDHPYAIDDKTDLQGVKVGVQRGSMQDDYVTQMYPKADIRRYVGLEDVVVDMEAGRLDLAMLGNAGADATLLKKKEYAVQGKPVTEPVSIFGKGSAVAFRKSDRVLKAAFNKGLDEVFADGTYDRLVQKYSDEKVYPVEHK